VAKAPLVRGSGNSLGRSVGSTLSRTKNFFFDRAIVRDHLTGATYSAIMSVSAYIRTVAINSMKRGTLKKSGKQKGKQLHSKPGKPPRYWQGLIRRFLFFAYDTRSESVVIGPMQLGGKSTVLRDLEMGNSAKGLAPRPYMEPAFIKGKKRLMSRLARAGFKKALKGKV
jgi:hypothetical protein